MENYYKTLPDNYTQAMVFDAKKAKPTLIMLAISTLLVFAVLVPLFICGGGISAYIDSLTPSSSWTLLVCLVFYLVLHELVHGLAYKVLTHHKLTFGFTLFVAYCGVPDIYTSRKTALISSSAPFVVFTVLYIPLIVWAYFFNLTFYFLFVLLFAIHLGGCAGDLYVMGLFLFKFKDQRCLMNDTGPKMTIYVPVENGIEKNYQINNSSDSVSDKNTEKHSLVTNLLIFAGLMVFVFLLTLLISYKYFSSK